MIGSSIPKAAQLDAGEHFGRFRKPGGNARIGIRQMTATREVGYQDQHREGSRYEGHAYAHARGSGAHIRSVKSSADASVDERLRSCP
jgi:hypothetical protein